MFSRTAPLPTGSFRRGVRGAQRSARRLRCAAKRPVVEVRSEAKPRNHRAISVVEVRSEAKPRNHRSYNERFLFARLASAGKAS